MAAFTFPTSGYITSVRTALETTHSKTTDESEYIVTGPHTYALLGKWEFDSKSAADSATDIIAALP